MAEFFQPSTAERLDALDAAANTSGLLPHLLEKDIWVVWSLRHLFGGPYADHLVFKGGTSLSKAYGVIRRFSEDVDLTYDIRAIASDLVGDADAPLPISKSQEKKWSKEIRLRLSGWVIEKLRREELLPLSSRIRTRLATEHASAEELLACLDHVLAEAGNASLMTLPLRHTLRDHAAGNYRILTTLAAELLTVAAQRELPLLDEKLYLEVFAPSDRAPSRRAGASR